jgi:hypothetical protein
MQVRVEACRLNGRVPKGPGVIATGIVLLACVALAGCGSPSASAPNSNSSSAPPKAAAGSTAPAPAATPPSASPTTPKTSGTGVDSMNVITQPEASAAIGEHVRPAVRGRATVEGGVAAVFYGPSVPVGTNPDVPSPNSVRVVLVTGPDAQKWFDDYRSKVHAVSLAGLGDRAYYDGYASVSVLKGDAYLRIAVAGPRGISLAGEKQLAADALPRM